MKLSQLLVEEEKEDKTRDMGTWLKYYDELFSGSEEEQVRKWKEHCDRWRVNEDGTIKKSN